MSLTTRKVFSFFLHIFLYEPKFLEVYLLLFQMTQYSNIPWVSVSLTTGFEKCASWTKWSQCKYFEKSWQLCRFASEVFIFSIFGSKSLFSVLLTHLQRTECCLHRAIKRSLITLSLKSHQPLSYMVCRSRKSKLDLLLLDPKSLLLLSQHLDGVVFVCQALGFCFK